MVKSNMGLLITSDHNQLHDEEIVVKEIEQSTFHCYIYLAYDKTKKNMPIKQTADSESWKTAEIEIL